jgi:alkylation response protein AidB-like acyl-CoA dehydrogenase
VNEHIDATEIRLHVRELLASHDTSDPVAFLGARFDAGLAWVHFPEGCGGLGADRSLQGVVEAELAAAAVPPTPMSRNPIGLGMVAPTLIAHGTPEQQRRLLRPLWTGEEVWCQLFSEPGAGSDLAGLATRAIRDGDEWVVTGQKVWTSGAQLARWAILIARTDPDVSKHRGLTYFVCDMTAAGVDVRPLRQITGQAEFNEVFLDDVRIPDDLRLGDVGAGWAVATTTLMNERVAIGGGAIPREGGPIGEVTRLWRDRPDRRRAGAHDGLVRLWVDSEVNRLANARLAQLLAAGQPGPEGSAVKLAHARLNQDITRFWIRLLGDEGLRYDDWAMRRVELAETEERCPGYHYLRAKGNSIEGGTSEILRNIIAERVLGLPREPRTDTDLPWKDIRR